MADVRPAVESGDTPPAIAQPQPSASTSASGPAEDDARGKNRESGYQNNANGNDPSASSASPQPPTMAEAEKQLEEVLASEIGVPAMLNRLKQSVASTKEFAEFLRRRSNLEKDYAQGLRKLCRTTQESMHRPDHREGSFLFACDEMMDIHERVADNSVQFAQFLDRMHDDLVEVAEMAERHRKGWKSTGMAAEQRVADIEHAVRKSKLKYDALAEEYDRARTGDGRGGVGKMSLFKMSKSPAQHEEDLLKKVQGADQLYHGHVQTLQSERRQLLSTTRPETIKALQELIGETDAVLLMQLEGYCMGNEKFVLSNGLTISPLEEQSGAEARGMRDAAALISNEMDLVQYILSHHTRIQPQQGEIKYEQHPILVSNAPLPLMKSGQQATSPAGSHQQSPSIISHHPQPSIGGGQQLPPTFSQPLPGAAGSAMQRPARSDSWGQNSLPGGGAAYGSGSRLSAADQFRPGSQPQPQPQPPHRNRSYSQMSQTSDSNQQQPQQQLVRFNRGPAATNGPPQLGALPFQSDMAAQPQPSAPAQYFQGSSSLNAGGIDRRVSNMPPPPPNPVPGRMFHNSLVALYDRDGTPVPLVVTKCIQAIEMYGMNMEGLYRQSGSMNQINAMKAMFDRDPYSPSLDFRNPVNFQHDINSVAGLLKQFFRDLPDPLLTQASYQDLIDGAKIEDDIVRRDSLHSVINLLNDPNYATLRALSLHLYHVAEKQAVTRMDHHNLAVIFGPTLMGTSSNMADSGWQAKVVETILINTHLIFDED